MGTRTTVYAGALVEMTCWCGIAHAVPQTLHDEQMRQHSESGRDVIGIYCPLGHQHVPAGESEAAKLRRQLNAERDRRFALQAERDQIEASRRALRGVVTRTRKRAVAGACPFGCGRHFMNLQRHVASKHPNRTFEGES